MRYPSQAFIDLSNRIERTLRSSGQKGADPFMKVKSLIRSMVDKLQDEAEDDANKKQYCDKELSVADLSKTDKEDVIEQSSTQVDVMSAASMRLKGETKRVRME